MKKLICGIAVAVLFSGVAYAGDRCRYTSYSGYKAYNPNRNVNFRYVTAPRFSGSGTSNAGMSNYLPNGTGQ